MILEHYLTVENFWKLVPILISSYTLVIVLQNRRSKIREMLYEKQYALILLLNQKIVDIESEIQQLKQWIQLKNDEEIDSSKTNYANLLHDFIRMIQLEGTLILPEKIIQSTDEIVDKYKKLLPEIINTSNQLNSDKLFLERLARLYLWQDMIRKHIEIEKLSKENKRIIG